MHTELLAVWIEWREPKIEPLFCGIYQGSAIDRVLDPEAIKLVVKSTEKVGGLRKVDIDAFGAQALRVGAAQDLLHSGNDASAIIRMRRSIWVDIMAHHLEFAKHNVWV